MKVYVLNKSWKGNMYLTQVWWIAFVVKKILNYVTAQATISGLGWYFGIYFSHIWTYFKDPEYEFPN